MARTIRNFLAFVGLAACLLAALGAATYSKVTLVSQTTTPSGGCAPWQLGLNTTTGSVVPCIVSTWAPISNLYYVQGNPSASVALSGSNAVDLGLIQLPYAMAVSKIAVHVGTVDASTSDFYSWGMYTLAGAAVCHITAINLNLGAAGFSDQACIEGTVAVQPGEYIFAWSGNAQTAKLDISSLTNILFPLSSRTSSTTTTSGQLTASISIPSAGQTENTDCLHELMLH